MKLNRILITLLLVSLGSTAGGPLPATQIDKIAFQSGGLYLYSNISWPNRNNCTKTEAVVLQQSDPNYDKAYSMVLAAFMAGKKVSGYSDECVTFDGHTYNSIRGTKYLVIE